MKLSKEVKECFGVSLFLVLCVAILCALAGCANPQTKVVYQPYEVKVPGPVVKCKVQVPEKPEFFLDAPGIERLTDFEKGQAMIGELEQRRAYEKELEAAVLECQ